MKKVILLVAIVCLSITCWAQFGNVDLLGKCTRADLQKEPFKSWFDEGYNNYKPDEEIISQLKNIDLKDCTITIFFATWCGDSHREVPRFIKLLDDINFSESAVTFVALSGDNETFKQSPTHEEQGKHIYRVPTFVIYKDTVEVGRIVEFPVISLEHDLLSILKGEKYVPNYMSHVYISKWLDEGLLLKDNVSFRGLANQIKHLTESVGELSSCGRVLSCCGSEGLKAAIKVHQINCVLYPNNYRAYLNLSQAFGELGEHEKAARMLQYAMEVNKDEKNVKYLLEQYDVVRDRVD